MRSLIVALTVASAIGLSACGGDDSGSAEPAAASAATAQAAAGNEADVTFVQGMIPHHEQAVEMAELALDPKAGASPKVKDLATRIKQAQDPEIEQLQGLLATWGEEEMDMSGGMAGHDMSGMMSAGEMDALAAANGTAFDQQWLGMMIKHHQGAIDMARTVQSKGSSADVKGLADQIISAQEAEITEMNGLMKG